VRIRALCVFGSCVLSWTGAFAGPKGQVICRHLGSNAITVDGDFSDWPLGAFRQPSAQPLFPAGQDAASTDASGDHLVFERDRIGPESPSKPVLPTTESFR